MASPMSASAQVPKPHPGERPCRDEFERRYGATPELKTAELIDGAVCTSAGRHAEHGSPEHVLGSG